MNPAAPAANPVTSNTNQPYGGFGQAQSDYGSAANILNNLPSQEATTTGAATNANTNTASILPNIAINAPTYTAPTAKTINAGSYGTNLTGYNAATQAATQALTSGENQTYSNALGQLQSAESQYGNLTPVYQNLANSYGIPGYQNDIATLTGLLQNLNRDVNAQTTLGGGLMTESARDEAYNNQAQPLQQSLNSAGEFLQYGQNDVNNLLDTYEKSLNNALTPLQTNISNLPTLFDQTNQAAQNQYGQGSTSIEDTIQNQQKQQEIAIDQANLALNTKEVNQSVGNGNLAALFSGQGQSAANGQTYTGAAVKNAGAGGSGGYAFTSGGKPVSMLTWAATNGLNPLAVLQSMAQAGDNTAAQAYGALYSNGGTLNNQIADQYSSLFWEPSQQASKPAAPKSSAPAPVNTGVFGSNNSNIAQDAAMYGFSL